MVLSITFLYFNSIKVRLKLGKRYKGRFNPQRFQFHKGTIKTVVCFCIHYR